MLLTVEFLSCLQEVCEYIPFSLNPEICITTECWLLQYLGLRALFSPYLYIDYCEFIVVLYNATPVKQLMTFHLSNVVVKSSVAMTTTSACPRRGCVTG